MQLASFMNIANCLREHIPPQGPIQAHVHSEPRIMEDSNLFGTETVLLVEDHPEVHRPIPGKD